MKLIGTKKKGVHKELKRLEKQQEYERQIKLKRKKTKSAAGKKTQPEKMFCNDNVSVYDTCIDHVFDLSYQYRYNTTYLYTNTRTNVTIFTLSWPVLGLM